MLSENIHSGLNLIIKHERATYLYNAGIRDVVCCSCGNTARKLRDVGIKVIEIGRKGNLLPNKWLSFEDINNTFPLYFDATSGHLPIHIMSDIAKDISKLDYLQLLPKLHTKQPLDLLAGSGETIVLLKMAFPEIKINAHYNVGPETAYNSEAPLNGLVKLFANKIIM